MTDTTPRAVPTTIKQQGAVLCNDAWVEAESDSIVCISMDLQTKYADLGASCGHGVMLDATERSLYLSLDHPREYMTWVEFTLPPGKWCFFAGRVSRYTLNCVFIKENTQ